MDRTHGAGTVVRKHRAVPGAQRALPRGTVEARVIDHVNNLKLQHLVELSKLGDRCAGIEEEIEAWLAEHDVVFAGNTIPFVLMPHFVSPGQIRRVKRAVAGLSMGLDRLCDAYPEDQAASAPTFPRRRGSRSWTWPAARPCPSSGSSARPRARPGWRRSTARSTTWS